MFSQVVPVVTGVAGVHNSTPVGKLSVNTTLLNALVVLLLRKVNSKNVASLIAVPNKPVSKLLLPFSLNTTGWLKSLTKLKPSGASIKTITDSVTLVLLREGWPSTVTPPAAIELVYEGPTEAPSETADKINVQNECAPVT